MAIKMINETNINKVNIKKIFNLLNDNEKFGLKFGLFPIKIQKYNLNNKQLSELIQYAKKMSKIQKI